MKKNNAKKNTKKQLVPKVKHHPLHAAFFGLPATVKMPKSVNVITHNLKDDE